MRCKSPLRVCRRCGLTKSHHVSSAFWEPENRIISQRPKSPPVSKEFPPSFQQNFLISKGELKIPAAGSHYNATRTENLWIWKKPFWHDEHQGNGLEGANSISILHLFLFLPRELHDEIWRVAVWRDPRVVILINLTESFWEQYVTYPRLAHIGLAGKEVYLIVQVHLSKCRRNLTGRRIHKVMDLG